MNTAQQPSTRSRRCSTRASTATPSPSWCSSAKWELTLVPSSTVCARMLVCHGVTLETLAAASHGLLFCRLSYLCSGAGAQERKCPPRTAGDCRIKRVQRRQAATTHARAASCVRRRTMCGASHLWRTEARSNVDRSTPRGILLTLH